MIKRGLALSLVLGLASVAQGGAVLELRPLQSGNAGLPLGTYEANEVATVELFLKQSAAGDDHVVRLLKLHFNDSELPLVSDQVVWDAAFDALAHYRDESNAGGPAGVAVAYAGKGDCADFSGACNFAVGCASGAACVPTNLFKLGPQPASMVTLPGDESEVKVGTLQVTMPGSEGTYKLDAMNADDPDEDLRAALSFGFGCSTTPCPGHADSTRPITFWRADGDLTGGTVDLTVAPPTGDPPVFGDWTSVGAHTSVGDVGLLIGEDGLYVEPRRSGISRILVDFTGGAIDPATAGPGSVSVVGLDAGGALDLSGIVITTDPTLAGNTQMLITFTPKLPGSEPSPVAGPLAAKYTITLSGITGAGGSAVTGAGSRCLGAVLGDAFNPPNGSGHVSSADAGLSRSFAAAGVDPIDTGNILHVRADVTGDGKVNSADAGLIRSMAAQGRDGRGLACP